MQALFRWEHELKQSVHWEGRSDGAQRGELCDALARRWSEVERPVRAIQHMTAKSDTEHIDGVSQAYMQELPSEAARILWHSSPLGRFLPILDNPSLTISALLQ